MEKEALKTLEYEKILALLQEDAGSVLGKEMAGSLLPTDDFDEAQEQLQQTAEALTVMQLASPPLGGIRDIRSQIKKVHLGAVLEITDITEVMSTLYAMRNLKQFFRGLETDAPLLKEWARSIEILGQLEHNLDNAIDEHGSLRDEASVELARIRREIRSSQARVKSSLTGILHAPEYQKAFQDAIVTMRGDRYVIPVKQEYRHAFPGIVHDQSATGATLFIEPMAVVELNNDIKQLTLAEHHEVERILRSLSEQIGRSGDTLQENLQILAKVDFTFAKAKLARRMQAVEPVLNDEGRVRLQQARHPLIVAAKVVPIDIRLGDPYRMLLITGPNTGGKTVCMKTLGLLALMAQSGCFIPAAFGSEMPVYHNIYADIGDEQSIEQSLSTFSSHMTHMVSILQQAETTDLLLLDELGAGTDPEEGASLAMAILEQLLKNKISVVATTHYSELKTFAYTQEGIENACVEFDVKTLRPTYRLLIGIPGASNAFAISRRLGLPASLVLRAGQLIQADHAQFEHVINELEHEKIMYEQRNADIMERQQRVTQLESKLETMKNELLQKKAAIIRKAREESATLVRRTRRESEEVIKELKEQFRDQGSKKRQQVIQTARDQLKESSSRVRSSIVADKTYRQRLDLSSLAVGDTVYVLSLAQKGTVAAMDGQELTVQLGSMKMTVKASGCRFVSSGKAAEAERNTHTSALYMQKVAAAHRELDIRGLMVDEGEQIVGKFLDDAALAGLKQVLIIHGKGTGALRKGIHGYLKRHKSVKDFNFADIDEGGTGATLVNLK
jgi:DNA mismatch repair protein MutS2